MTKRSYRDEQNNWGIATALQMLLGYQIKKTYDINDLIKVAMYFNIHKDLKSRLEATYTDHGIIYDSETIELQNYVIKALTWGLKEGGE